jgi:hypothetical protein
MADLMSLDQFSCHPDARGPFAHTNKKEPGRPQGENNSIALLTLSSLQLSRRHEEKKLDKQGLEGSCFLGFIYPPLIALCSGT